MAVLMSLSVGLVAEARPPYVATVDTTRAVSEGVAASP